MSALLIHIGVKFAAFTLVFAFVARRSALVAAGRPGSLLLVGS